jgi:orotate phosphoribosyltransferase
VPETDSQAMNYRSIASFNQQIIQWMSRLPRDITVVVGIPRSGLLAANLLALHRNLPLTDVDRLIEGKLIQTGERYGGSGTDSLLSARQTVLVLDDSVATGNQINQVKAKIVAACLPHTIYYGAVYALPGSERLVDFFAEALPSPRVFEWNVMHHGELSEFCVDIDGVLCVDPTDEENDDGKNYENFLSNAAPLIIPTKRIGALVTCRLEKYRNLTKEWLTRHGVKYDKLYMLDLPNKKARLAANCHAKYKARIYKDLGASFFIESSLGQAVDIAKFSGKQVLCMETGEMITPGNAAAILQSTVSLPKRLRRKLPKSLRSRLKAWVGGTKPAQ